MSGSAVVTWIFRRDLLGVSGAAPQVSQAERIPFLVTVVHLVFLGLTVFFGHSPPVCLGLLMAFIGFAHAYERYQSRLMIIGLCWLPSS